MQFNPLVSVLINNYNYGRFVEEAIESVLKQTYRNFEIVIVDDGSSDESKQIIQKYQRRYPDIITAVYKENGGQASAFNRGVMESHGEILAFLDSDDYWYENKLEKIVKAHETSEFVGHAKHYSNGKKEDANRTYRDRRKEFLRQYGFMNNMGLFTSTISISKKLAHKIFPMPESNLKVSADYYVVIFALYYTNVSFLEEELSYYRIHGRNLYACDNDIFGSIESMVNHNKAMDNLIRNYINDKLKIENEIEIPELTKENRTLLWQQTEHPFSLNKNGKYLLYGTGSKAIKYELVLQDFDAEIIGYCDSNMDKCGTIWRGKMVYSPDELVHMRHNYDKVIIASVHYEEIGRKLCEMGLQRDIDFIYAEIGV